MAGQRKFGPKIDAAIREARVAGMGATDTLRKLRAGNLFGITRPVEIGRTAFYTRWREAGRELNGASRPGPANLKDSILQQLAAEANLTPEERNAAEVERLEAELVQVEHEAARLRSRLRELRREEERPEEPTPEPPRSIASAPTRTLEATMRKDGENA